MDRLPRFLALCGFVVLVAAPGCRSTRPEVPPGRPFSKDGQQRKAIEFSSDGHPTSAAASNSLMTGGVDNSGIASGIGSRASRPDGASFGAPRGAYGAPGTSGLAQPRGQEDPATSPAAMPPVGMPPLDTMPDLSSPPPDLSVPPARGLKPSPDSMPMPN